MPPAGAGREVTSHRLATVLGVEEPPSSPDIDRPEALLDVVEYARWMRTAQRHAGLAEVARREGYPQGTVLHAEQAAQRALKALLHCVGARAAARGHGLLGFAAELRGAGGPADLRRAALRSAGAGDHLPVQPLPGRAAGGNPRNHYDDARAERSLGIARQTIEAVGQQRAALESAQGREEP